MGTNAAPPGRGRSPRDYTPKHLAEKILTQKSALEGERKQVTVLFADVKGSLDMQNGIDPEQWHQINAGVGKSPSLGGSYSGVGAHTVELAG